MLTINVFRLLAALALACAAPKDFGDLALKCDKPGHVYTTDEEVVLHITGQADGQQLHVRLADPRDKTTRQSDVSVSGQEISLGRVGPGWYRLTATGSGGQRTSVDFAVARPRQDSSFRDDSPFGVVGAPHTAEEWPLFAAMGVKWIQFSIPWAYAETKPGLYWFSPGAPKYNYDGAVVEANKHGIRAVLQIRDVPRWANAGRIGSYRGEERSISYPPDDEHWGAFEKFIGVVVDRFRPLGVHRYEMWSEAEGDMFKHWDTPRFPKVEAYQKMLTHARTALRAHDPDALLLAAGDEPVNFLRAAEQGYTAPETSQGKASDYAGLRLPGIGSSTVDIVSGHFYWTDWQSSPRRIWAPEVRNPMQQNRTLRSIIEDAKELAGHRPVWITEVGYASARSAETPDEMFASEDEQASLLTRYYVLSLAWGVEKVFWYLWKDTPQTSYGLLRGDGMVKPAYLAYRTMTERLEGLKFDRLVESGPERWIARFTGPRTVLVVWKTTPDDETRKVSVPWAHVRLTARDGAETTLDRANGSVRVALHGGEPVYLDEQP